MTEATFNVTVSKHAVLSHKISILRSSATTHGTFRNVLREVTYHLGYEATANLKTKEIPISVSMGKEAAEEHTDCTGRKIADRVALIPILRSGLGMADGMLELLPKAAVHHIGMYHLPGSAPVQYFNRLPKKCDADVAIIVDPVIASAETVMAVVGILKKWKVPKIQIICVIASKQGLEKITADHPDVFITVGAVDDVLTEKGIVMPGLGDAGNRLYGTNPLVDEDDEDLVHASKRTRTGSIDRTGM